MRFQALSQRCQLVQWLHGLDHRQAHASERYNSSIELGFQLREQAEPSVFPGLALKNLIGSIQDALTQEGRCVLTEGLCIRKPWVKPGVQLSLNASRNVLVKALAQGGQLLAQGLNLILAALQREPKGV